MRTRLLVMVLALGGCQVGPADDDGGNGDDVAMIIPPGGEGDACDLEGYFVPCEGGVRYCDDLDGALVLGECVVDQQCELWTNVGCGECALVDGVPIWTPMPEQCVGDDGG